MCSRKTKAIDSGEEDANEQPAVCLFPLCKSHPVHKGYCIGHRIYANDGGVKEKAKPQPIKKVGEKMKKELKLYRPQVKDYLARPENKICLIQSPVCTKEAKCVNHKKRRGTNLRNEQYFEPSCFACNNYIESHTEWAEENGHLIPVHQIEAI